MDLEGLRKSIVADLTGERFRELLDAVWSEWGEAGQAQHLVEVNRSVKWSPQNFPCAEVSAPRGRRFNAESSQHNDVLYETSIFFHVIGNDEERIDDELQRLVRATQDFYLTRPHVYGCSAYLGDEDYSPLVSQGDGRPYVKSALQVLFVRMQRV